MPRRNQGPRLRFLDKRALYYICWTEDGRSRERSTGTADRQQAEIALADFLHVRNRSAGPRDPAEILVTDALANYAEEVAPRTASPWRIGCPCSFLAFRVARLAKVVVDDVLTGRFPDPRCCPHCGHVREST